MHGNPHIVSDVMSTTVATARREAGGGDGRVVGAVSEADPLPKEEARTMAHAQVGRLPVVDDVGVLPGIVSRADLRKVFLRRDEDIAEEIRREVVSYLFLAPASAVRVSENGPPS